MTSHYTTWITSKVSENHCACQHITFAYFLKKYVSMEILGGKEKRAQKKDFFGNWNESTKTEVETRTKAARGRVVH